MTERTHTGQCPGPGKLLGAEESVLITFKSVKKNIIKLEQYTSLYQSNHKLSFKTFLMEEGTHEGKDSVHESQNAALIIPLCILSCTITRLLPKIQKHSFSYHNLRQQSKAQH